MRRRPPSLLRLAFSLAAAAAAAAGWSAPAAALSAAAGWSCALPGPFDARDDAPADRAALAAFAKSAGWPAWTDGTRKWLDPGYSMCSWEGICCTRVRAERGLAGPGRRRAEMVDRVLDDGEGGGGHGGGGGGGGGGGEGASGGLLRVTEIHVERNGLRGRFPDNFTASFPLLRVLNVHLNNMTNFPPRVDLLAALEEAKFGRNPICGDATRALAGFRNLSKLTKFNCNFCCLTGEFPGSVLRNKPRLTETFWDGNNLTGSIPQEVAGLRSLSKISFNLNSMSGDAPAGLCQLPLLQDCRIGSDVDYTPYDLDSEYRWLVKARGNLFACPVPDCIFHGVCNDPHASPVPSPVRCEKHHPSSDSGGRDCRVTAFGARCDGRTDDTAAIQAALNACAGATAGSVVVPGDHPPQSVCMSRPLVLPSHTRLFLEPGAVLKAASKWNDTTFIQHAGAVGENITISGYGATIDGSGELWWTGSNLTPHRPRMLELEAVGVLLEGVTLLNPAAWCASLGGAQHRVKDIKIRSPDYQKAPNTDGLDIHGRDVHVSGCDIMNGDDSICIKAPAANVLVENNTVRQGNGLVVGTSSHANFSNITFRNCTAIGTAFGCHIKFKNAQTGFCRGVTFEDIRIEDPTRYAIGIDQDGQGDGGDGDGVGSSVHISDIRFTRISGRAAVGGLFVCNTGDLACRNVSLEDVRLNTTLGGCLFRNVFGSGKDVSPASCVPPVEI
jgi:hypothetical protein